MNAELSLVLQERAYEKYALEYLASLPLEHFMESTDQSRQKEITVASLGLLKARRRDVQVYAELLVQYPLPRRRKPGQVVPDNMVVLSDKPCRAKWSFNVALESAPPFWVLEYVSRNNPRKDYTLSYRKYERQLKVPYCLMFYPEKQDLRLFHHDGKRYVKMKPDAQGRYRIKELDLELCLLDEWIRYWYKGKLLPLPVELQQSLDETKRELAAVQQQAAAAQQQAAEEKSRADELQRQLEAAQRALAEMRPRRK